MSKIKNPSNPFHIDVATFLTTSISLFLILDFFKIETLGITIRVLEATIGGIILGAFWTYIISYHWRKK